MGKIPIVLRETIARNIRNCRSLKFPGRGGGKKCAAAFSEFVGQNVSPQQWSPWERGMRTPDETRLAQMAEFFGVTVEWLRRDNTLPPPPAADRAGDAGQRPIASTDCASPGEQPLSPGSGPGPSAPELFSYLYQHKVKAVYRVEVMVTDVRYVALPSPAFDHSPSRDSESCGL